jgi:hypothetical protein
MMHLQETYAHFCNLLTLAEDYFKRGDYSATARLAQVAARYAYPAHVGLFGSPRLEGLLLELGKQIPIGLDSVGRKPNGSSRKILHILSYAQPIGGDTRFAWRWIQEDRNNRHFVAITSQADIEGKYDFPEFLKKAAESTGGSLRTLDTPTSKPMEQARELRVLCQEMDLVALHVYPYDIIPLLALSVGCDACKTLFINHADHTFWMGGSVAHSIVHLRRQRLDFLKNERGLSPDHSSILPIPLAYSPSSINSKQAKLSLGYASDVVILLTIATPFKYYATGQIGFLELVTPVIERFPKAVLIAVGPGDEGIWRSAKIRTNGRIAALGKRWDNELRFAAADIYLDSVPFSSITSLLEAGSRAIPLLGMRPAQSDLWVFGPGAPGLDNAMELADSMESYRNLLARLINDESFRRESGERVQSQILSLHTGKNWLATLHNLYEKVQSRNDRGCLLEKRDNFNMGSLNRTLDQLWGREAFRINSLIGNYIGTLPYRIRAPLTWRLFLKGLDLCILNLLPPPIDDAIRHVGRRGKKIVRKLQALF